MKNNTRKIVVLDKLNSSRIEQAIFILRDTEQNLCESDAVSEAQRIVDEYLRSRAARIHEECEPKKKYGSMFVIGMIVYTFSTMLLTTYLLALTRG